MMKFTIQKFMLAVVLSIIAGTPNKYSQQVTVWWLVLLCPSYRLVFKKCDFRIGKSKWIIRRKPCHLFRWYAATFLSRLLDITMMCLLIRLNKPHIQFLFVSTGVCRLLTVQGVTPARKGLAPSGNKLLHTYYLFHLKICILRIYSELLNKCAHALAGHTQWLIVHAAITCKCYD